MADDDKLMAAVSYIWIIGLIFYVAKKDASDFLRFHSAQSVIYGLGVFIIYSVLALVAGALSVIPVLGWIGTLLVLFVNGILILIFGLFWIFLVWKAFSGERYKAPLIGAYAEQYAKK